MGWECGFQTALIRRMILAMQFQERVHIFFVSFLNGLDVLFADKTFTIHLDRPCRWISIVLFESDISQHTRPPTIAVGKRWRNRTACSSTSMSVYCQWRRSAKSLCNSSLIWWGDTPILRLLLRICPAHFLRRSTFLYAT